MKKNIHMIHVTPCGLSKPAFGALLMGALLCTAAFAVSLAFAVRFSGDTVSIPAAVALIALLGCVGLWPCFWYYGIYLPKFSIAINLTEKELTLVTPRKRKTVSFREVSYIVTTSVSVRPTYYLHLFHQEKKLIRINTGDWNNIRFLLDLPHKPTPKISKLKELRKYS